MQPAEPAEPAAASGTVVQLGAYVNQAQAEAGWTSLTGRYPAIAAMTKLVVPFSGGFRLRAIAASPDDARNACQLLKVAGDSCFVVR